jgi:hypothetical protein
MQWQQNLARAYVADGLPHGRLVSVCFCLSCLLLLICHCCILLLSVILLNSKDTLSVGCCHVILHFPTDALEHAGSASQLVPCHKGCCMQGTWVSTRDGERFVTTQVEGVTRAQSKPGVGWGCVEGVPGRLA